MNTWKDVQSRDFKTELRDEEKYSPIGARGKPEAIIIDIEFAKTMSGDMKKILEELNLI